ncbi:MAG: histidine kinase [Pseudohongiellaceae bacterium]
MTLSRNKQFWIFQFAGWSAWVLLLIIRDLTFVPADYMMQRSVIFIADAAVGITLTTLLRYLYRAVWEKPMTARIVVVLIACLPAALIWEYFKEIISLLPDGDSVDLTDYGWVDMFAGVLPFAYALLLLWSGLYFFIKYYQLFQEEKEKSLRSEALAHQAQLRMLRYQLNPHFLFNTLNAISTLVLDKATGPANEMLTKLGKFLRYTLDHSPLDLVTLAHELQTCRLYLDIEKVRFEERLRLELDIDPQAEDALVPSMLLQPLVENSIKYAISRSEAGGYIRIAARVENQRLTIEVVDDGPGLTGRETDVENRTGPETASAENSGVGLTNTRNRLQEFYGERHTVEISNMQPSGCRVMVIIPYERERAISIKNHHSR